MAVLSDIDIQNIVNKKGLVINPFNLAQLTGVGYDLTIGCIVDADSQDLPECIDGEYLLEGGHRYIVITKEYIWFSRSIMGTLHARGSLSLAGLSTTSTTVDPNFRGHMAMCVVNLSSSPISIKENEPFITLVIHKLQKATKLPLAITEDGHPRVAQRKISSIFSDETDVRRAKLNNYLAQQEQLEHFENSEVISRADFSNYLKDTFYEGLRFLLSNKSRALVWTATLILLAIIVFCLYSLYDSTIILRFVPNYSNSNLFQIPAIISAIAALIALHKKK